jgi:hypothetical protein
MAIKLTIGTSFAWSDGVDTMSGKGTTVLTPTGVKASESIQEMDSTTPTSIDLAGITPGYLFLENKDLNNSITVGSDAAVANVVCVLKPKESVIVGTTVTAIWGKAANAPSNLLVIACEA